MVLRTQPYPGLLNPQVSPVATEGPCAIFNVHKSTGNHTLNAGGLGLYE